jgi:hypothetical protein
MSLAASQPIERLTEFAPSQVSLAINIELLTGSVRATPNVQTTHGIAAKPELRLKIITRSEVITQNKLP